MWSMQQYKWTDLLAFFSCILSHFCSIKSAAEFNATDFSCHKRGSTLNSILFWLLFFSRMALCTSAHVYHKTLRILSMQNMATNNSDKRMKVQSKAEQNSVKSTQINNNNTRRVSVQWVFFKGDRRRIQPDKRTAWSSIVLRGIPLAVENAATTKTHA